MDDTTARPPAFAADELAAVRPRFAAAFAWFAGSFLALPIAARIGAGLLAAVALLALVVTSIVVALITLRRDGRLAAIAFAPAGVGLLCLYISMLNHDGPRKTCATGAVGVAVTCESHVAPLPYVVVGVALIAITVAIAVAARRSAR